MEKSKEVCCKKCYGRHRNTMNPMIGNCPCHNQSVEVSNSKYGSPQSGVPITEITVTEGEKCICGDKLIGENLMHNKAYCIDESHKSESKHTNCQIKGCGVCDKTSSELLSKYPLKSESKEQLKDREETMEHALNKSFNSQRKVTVTKYRIVSPKSESKEQLKEEWNCFVKDTREYGEFPEALVCHVEDFWLSKIDLLLKQQKEGIVKEIEELKKSLEMTPFNLGSYKNRRDRQVTHAKRFHYNKALEDVINIINNNHPSL